MKRNKLSVTVFSCFFICTGLISCGGDEQQNEGSVIETSIEEDSVEEVVEEANVGKDLFSSNGCLACHHQERKVVGPSLKTIAIAYDGNKEGMISFLKEEADAIVDPDQYPVMQANLAVTKKMKDVDLEAIVDYILSNK